MLRLRMWQWAGLAIAWGMLLSCGVSGSDPEDLVPTGDFAMPGVEAGPLDSIRVVPSRPFILPDDTVKFTAAGVDANGIVLPGLVFTWESSNASVASIDRTGVATGITMGTTTITARTGGESGIATLAVSEVATIQVIPLEVRTVPGGSLLFRAVARDSRGIEIAGGSFAWTSSNPEIAAISPTGSLARVTGISLGNTQILASADQVMSQTSPLTVTTASSLEIIPKTLNLARGSTKQFAALVKDPAGQVITGAPVEWESSDSSIVTIDENGLATAITDGDVEITADIDKGARIEEILFTPAALTVTPDVISSIQITPLSGITVPGSILQFTATARNAAGVEIQNVAFDWDSSDTTKADVNRDGAAIGIGEGEVVITASAGGVTSSSAPLVVTTVSSIEVLPTATSISVGNTTQFSATIVDDSERLVETESAEWTSSDPAVATIDSNGVATGVSAGITEISASAGGIVSDPNNPALLTVTAVVSVTITTTASTVDATKTLQFTAVAKDAIGTTVVGVPFTWASSNVLVATIDPTSGVVTGVSTGTTVVTALAEGVESNKVTVTVTATGVPDSVAVDATPKNASGTPEVSVFGTATVEATVKDNAGTPVPSFVVDFIVTDPSFGTVSSVGTTNVSGIATATFKAAEKPGTAIVSATAGTKSSSQQISISPANTVSIEFKSAVPPVIGLKGAGQTETSVVTFLVKDTNGNPVSDGVKVCFALKGPGPGAAITPAEGSTAGFGTSTAGEVEIILQSGTVPGPARIVATVAVASTLTVPAACTNLTSIATESAPVSIGGGVPDLAHFSLALSVSNIASFMNNPRVTEIDNVQTTLTTFIADQFGNFNVLEGTSISYIIEAGSIDTSNTLDDVGTTSVTLRTQSPAPVDRNAASDTTTIFGGTTGSPGPFVPCEGTTGTGCNFRDGLVTIVALVKGQECFNDVNGNGVFDSTNAAGEFDAAVTQTICDQGEPFINANDNLNANGTPKFDANEIFIDVDGDGSWDGPNGVWDGPTGATGAQTTIWKTATVAFSGRPNQIQAAYTRLNAGGGSDFCLEAGESQSITLRIGDNNDPNRGSTLDTSTATPANRPLGNAPMPGSTVTITTTAGGLAGAGPFVIPDIVGGPFERTFSIANTLVVPAVAGGAAVADAAAAIEVQVNWVVPEFGSETHSIFINGILKGLTASAVKATC